MYYVYTFFFLAPPVCTSRFHCQKRYILHAEYIYGVHTIPSTVRDCVSAQSEPLVLVVMSECLLRGTNLFFNDH